MTTGILQRRAEIERDIEGRTVCDHLRETAESSGGAPALSDQAGDGTGWQTLTWGQTRQRVLELAAGFAALGLAKGERVALMLPNRSEHILADLAAVHAGGTPVTFYATLARGPDRLRRGGLRRPDRGAGRRRPSSPAGSRSSTACPA